MLIFGMLAQGFYIQQAPPPPEAGPAKLQASAGSIAMSGVTAADIETAVHRRAAAAEGRSGR
jgi:hypothetical protein